MGIMLISRSSDRLPPFPPPSTLTPAIWHLRSSGCVTRTPSPWRSSRAPQSAASSEKIRSPVVAAHGARDVAYEIRSRHSRASIVPASRSHGWS